MIQSKQPVAGVPKENSKVPFVATFTIIHVLFNSPASKQPKFPDATFVDGFEKDPVVNSTVFPDPLGSIWNVAFVQILTEPEQSEAITGPGGGGGGVPHGAQMTFANHPV